MPRPKGSKKDKSKTNKILHKSLSRSSISSSLLSSQTSIPLVNINYPNDLINDDIDWINTSIVSKGGRPKKKDDSINNVDANLISTNISISSSSEINGSRVVINPAVIRYLEQNRNINYSSIINKTYYKSDESFNKDTLKIITYDKDDHLFEESSTSKNNISMNNFMELDKFIQDDLFWDFCTYSTDFLTSARLARWILTYQ